MTNDLSSELAKKQKPELRVLQVFSSLGVGGAEIWLIALLRYLREAQDSLPFRVRFDILLTDGEKQILEDEAQELGARLIHVNYSQRRLPAFRREFRRVLERGRYHAIHDHQGYPAGIHFLLGLGRLPRVRITHIHNPIYDLQEYMTPRNKLVIECEKRLLAVLATHITATSTQMLIEHGFQSTLFNKVRRETVHCGFDVSRFYTSGAMQAHSQLCQEFGWAADSKIMLFAGRIGTDLYQGHDPEGNGQSRKNPTFAVTVAIEAIRRNPNVRLLLAGGGEYTKAQLENYVQEQGLKDKIRFLGVRGDLPYLMSGADLLLFPSRAEGLGMVVVEAQAAGLRIIASDTTPHECMVVPDMVTFCSLESSPTNWADKALHLMSLPRLNREECNQAVANSAFDIGKSALHLLRLYSGNRAGINSLQ